MNIRRTFYQRLLETAAVMYAYTLMLLSGISFANNPNSIVFETLKRELGFSLDGQYFSVASFIGALALIVLLFRRMTPLYNRIIYVLSGLPVAIYAVLVIIYSGVIGMVSVGAAILPAIYFSFLIIAASVYRPYEER